MTEEARGGMKEEGTSLTHPCFPSKEGSIVSRVDSWLQNSIKNGIAWRRASTAYWPG
jgi:hypothetical protein